MGKVLPPYLSKWTTERMSEEGVNVIPDTQVEEVRIKDQQLRLKLLNGQDLLVDHVIVAVGSKPDVALAKSSGLEIDRVHGGYVVNAELEARRHLYVVGLKIFNIAQSRFLFNSICKPIRLETQLAFTTKN